jgi:hypothetical protein
LLPTPWAQSIFSNWRSASHSKAFQGTLVLIISPNILLHIGPDRQVVPTTRSVDSQWPGHDRQDISTIASVKVFA